jgi:hypothetical protein
MNHRVRLFLKCHYGYILPNVRRAHLGSWASASSRLPIIHLRMIHIVDGIIEIIDPQSGQLIATARFPQALKPGQGGLSMSRHDGDNGELYFYIWRVALTGLKRNL